MYFNSPFGGVFRVYGFRGCRVTTTSVIAKLVPRAHAFLLSNVLTDLRTWLYVTVIAVFDVFFVFRYRFVPESAT